MKLQFVHLRQNKMHKKSDVTVAKNYLTEFEISQLNRMVTAYLDFVENMALRKIPLTIQDQLFESDYDKFIREEGNYLG